MEDRKPVIEGSREEVGGLGVKPLVVPRLLGFASALLSAWVKIQTSRSCLGDWKMQEGIGSYDLPSQGAGDCADASIFGKRMEFHGSSWGQDQH